MGTRRVVAYIDTNIIIEHRPLREHPWLELLDASDALLMISKDVFDELDKFKDRPGSARTKRQRAATRARELDDLLFRKTRDHAKPAELKQGVSLDYDDLAIPPSVFEEHHLDPALPDNRIVAAALAAKARFPDRIVAFVADDGGARRAALRRGLEVFQPSETTKVQDDPDPLEKELRETKRELNEMKNRIPKLRLGSTSALEFVVRSPLAPVGEYVELASKQAARKVRRLDKPEDTREQLRRALDPILASNVALYNTRVEKYHQALRAALPKYIEHLNAVGLFIPLDELCVRNDGDAPAEKVEVILRPPEGFGAVREEPSAPALPPLPSTKNTLDLLAGSVVANSENAATRNLVAALRGGNRPSWNISACGNTSEAHITVELIRHRTGFTLPRLLISLPSYEEVRPFQMGFEVHELKSRPLSGALDIIVKQSAEHLPLELFPEPHKGPT